VAQHRPTGSEQHHLTLPEATDLAQNRPLLRTMSMYGATQSELHARNDNDEHHETDTVQKLIHTSVFVLVMSITHQHHRNL